jgi:phage/plasmid-like protein (TIGR03299 family)
MSDEVNSGMFVNQPAWHGKGKLLFDWPGSWELAAKEAGIDWDLDVLPVYDARPANPDGTLNLEEIPGYKSIRRSDNHDLLSVMPDTYHPITNRDFGDVIEMVMSGATGHAPKFDALVSLRGGRVIAATMITGVGRVPGDPSPIAQYVVFYTSHDGSYAFRCGPNSVRVVCANTQRAADEEFRRTGMDSKFKHTANWKDRVDLVRDNITMAVGSHDVFMAMACDLAVSRIGDTQVEEFVDRWIPYSTDMTERQMANVMERRSRFWSIYRGVDGEITMEGIRDTKWGVYQAAIELRDHYSESRKDDALISRILLRGDEAKPRALKILASL